VATVRNSGKLVPVITRQSIWLGGVAIVKGAFVPTSTSAPSRFWSTY
jgi:hypothetical protein